MSDIRENFLPGDPNNGEGNQSELKAPQPLSENPTRLIGTDVDPGPQMPKNDQETSIEPIASESIAEPVAEINSEQSSASSPDLQPLPEAPASELGSEPVQELSPEPIVNSEPTMTPEPVGAAEKNYQVMEAMYKAPDLNALLAAYHEMSENNRSGVMGVAKLQEAMAENMARLGHPEKAIDFTLLAEQTANNSRFDESVKHLADLLNKTLPYHITNLLEGLQELNRQSQNRN